MSGCPLMTFDPVSSERSGRVEYDPQLILPQTLFISKPLEVTLFIDISFKLRAVCNENLPHIDFHPQLGVFLPSKPLLFLSEEHVVHLPNGCPTFRPRLFIKNQ